MFSTIKRVAGINKQEELIQVSIEKQLDDGFQNEF